jgi:hypothetical protein
MVMAGLLGGLKDLLFGEAPKYQAPEVQISGADIDKLINLMRSRGSSEIFKALGESQRSGTEMMASQGLLGTGGIPAQLRGQLQAGAFGAIGGLESNLGGLQLGSKLQLQQLLNQNAMAEFQADFAGYQSGVDSGTGLLDLGSSAALLALL